MVEKCAPSRVVGGGKVEICRRRRTSLATARLPPASGAGADSTSATNSSNRTRFLHSPRRPARRDPGRRCRSHQLRIPLHSPVPGLYRGKASGADRPFRSIEQNRLRIDVTDLLRPSDNEIAVRFRPAAAEAHERAAKLPFPVPWSVSNNRIANMNVIRKAQCHAGWDWGPCLMVLGLLRAPGPPLLHDTASSPSG